MGKTDTLIVVGAAYSDVADAMADFSEVEDWHVEGEIADYDGAIVTKEPSGMLQLSNAHSAGRFKGVGAGAVVGGILGVVFPPSMIGMAALGAGAGALAGHTKKHIGKGDIKSLGELLNPGETGILIVTEHISDKAAVKLLPRAIRRNAIEVEGDAEAIKTAVREAAELRDVTEA